MRRPQFLGRVVYWMGWPVSFVSLYFSRRSRVLIIYGDEILLAKNWMGSGDWHSPGGGIRRNESPEVGAVRELEEELGIVVDPAQLKLLYDKRITTRRKLTYHAYCYVLELQHKPELKPDTHEIAEVAWHKLPEVKQQKIGWPLIGEMLRAWETVDRL